MKHLILCAMLCVVTLSWTGCKSTKAQNELTMDYKSIVNVKKVDVTAVYNAVRKVLADEKIPNFTTQLTNRYAIETEWVGIRHGREFATNLSRSPAPFDSRYPTYIKYFLDIDKKGYSISAITNSGGIQWTSYDRSYKPNIFVDVMPMTDYWDFVTRLSRNINTSIKDRVGGGGGGYSSSFFAGQGSSRSYFPESTYPEQASAGYYPETPRNLDSTPAPAPASANIDIVTSSMRGIVITDGYGNSLLTPQNPGTAAEDYPQLQQSQPQQPQPQPQQSQSPTQLGDSWAMVNQGVRSSTQQNDPSSPLGPEWVRLRGEYVGGR